MDTFTHSEATDISFDGSVIVGSATRDGFTEPFIWDETDGMRSLVPQLLNDGVDVPLNNVSCDCFISADGTVIAGNGNNLGWIAILSDGPTGPPVAADLTGNGFVDFDDLTILLAHWNQHVPPGEGNLVDPFRTPVDFQDLTFLLADGTGPGPVGSPEAALGEEAVPEPSGLMLALFALLGVCCWRRRRQPA